VDISRVKDLEQTVMYREKLASIGQMGTGIAHEIRNPLSGINLNVSTLELLCQRAEGLVPEEKEMIGAVVAQAKASSEKIATVIRRIMDFSKPVLPRMERADLNQVVRESIATPEIAGRKGDVELREHLFPEPLYCYADPALLGLVLLNLVTNAFQAMEEVAGPKRITISVAREGDLAVVLVADTGPGLPGHLREKIFDPFFTMRRGGHGIGLSLSQRIASKHGGRISAGSAEGGGAEFRVELPLAEERSRE
jgi:signal transduction histidine kinase